MFELAALGAIPEPASERAEELFQQHRRQIFRQTDQLFAKLMLFQWLACHLPDLPGHKVLARLRQDELTCDIPVVVISADATARQIERLMAAGARNYLTKPIDIREFFRVIDETLRTRNHPLEDVA
jgi:CheY-like chemotaxis protein